MSLSNDKSTSALQQLTFLDDLAASERRNISDVIFRRIRDAIISGELPPGYVFPNENELCKKLNIGRSSLREAYSPLETLKLITRSKSGTYVNDLDIYQNAMNFEAIAERISPDEVIGMILTEVAKKCNVRLGNEVPSANRAGTK